MYIQKLPGLSERRSLFSVSFRRELLLSEDARLMDEINAFADAAEDRRTIFADLGAVAISLAAKYPHKSAVEIEEKARAVWRSRDLHWME